MSFLSITLLGMLQRWCFACYAYKVRGAIVESGPPKHRSLLHVPRNGPFDAKVDIYRHCRAQMPNTQAHTYLEASLQDQAGLPYRESSYRDRIAVS